MTAEEQAAHTGRTERPWTLGFHWASRLLTDLDGAGGVYQMGVT